MKPAFDIANLALRPSGHGPGAYALDGAPVADCRKEFVPTID